MIDRHGNENWTVINRVLSCAYTWPNGDQCGLPWNHTEPHREPSSDLFPRLREMDLHELLSLSYDSARATLAPEVAARVDDLLDTLSQIDAAPSESWIPSMLTSIVIGELRLILAEGDDLLTDEHRSRILVLLATG